MKKFFIAVVIALALVMVFPSQAFAAVITASSNPGSLSAEGWVTLSVTILNDSQTSMTNISLEGPGVSYSALDKTIPAGEKLTLSIPDVLIEEANIGNSLKYTLSWQEDGVKKSSKVSLTVHRLNEGAAALVASRTVSKSSAQENEEIYITYSIQNTGTVQARKISITDRNIAGKNPIVSGITIEPGQSYQYVYKYKMGSATVISKPVIKYFMADDSKTERTYNISNLSIGLINANIEYEVLQGPTTQQGTEFQIKLVNNGNQTVKNIVVKDEKDQPIHSGSFSLSIGQEKTLTYSVPSDEARNLRFTITGVDNTNQEYIQTTKSYQVRKWIDPSLVNLDVFVTVKDDGTGGQVLEYIINNTGSLEMKNAVITEEVLGELKQVGDLLPGETKVEIPINETSKRELSLTLTAEDPAGNQHSFESYIYAGKDASSAPVMTLEESKGGISMVSVAIALCILFGVLTILCALVLFRKKAAMQRRHPQPARESIASVSQGHSRSSSYGRTSSNRSAPSGPRRISPSNRPSEKRPGPRF